MDVHPAFGLAWLCAFRPNWLRRRMALEFAPEAEGSLGCRCPSWFHMYPYNYLSLSLFLSSPHHRQALAVLFDFSPCMKTRTFLLECFMLCNELVRNSWGCCAGTIGLAEALSERGRDAVCTSHVSSRYCPSCWPYTYQPNTHQCIWWKNCLKNTQNSPKAVRNWNELLDIVLT